MYLIYLLFVNINLSMKNNYQSFRFGIYLSSAFLESCFPYYQLLLLLTQVDPKAVEVPLRPVRRLRVDL